MNIYIYRAIFAPNILEITIAEVGKGQAVLVRMPHKKTLLINTGSDASILRTLGTALPEWQRRLDAIVLTSGAASAVGGLSEVLNYYNAPTPLRFGTAAAPYGSHLSLDGVSVVILAPSTLTINYGSASLSISSTTPAGVYISNGQTMEKTKSPRLF